MREGIGSDSWAWTAGINGLYSYVNMVFVYQPWRLRSLVARSLILCMPPDNVVVVMFRGLFLKR